MLNLHNLILDRLDFLSKLIREVRIITFNRNDMGKRSVILFKHN